MDACNSHVGTSSNLKVKVDTLAARVHSAMTLMPEWDRLESRFRRAKADFEALSLADCHAQTLCASVQNEIRRFPGTSTLTVSAIEEALQKLEGLVERARAKNPSVKQLVAAKIKRDTLKEAVATEAKRARLELNEKYRNNPNLIHVLKRIYSDHRRQDPKIDDMFANPKDCFEGIVRALGCAEYALNQMNLFTKVFQEDTPLFVKTRDELDEILNKVNVPFFEMLLGKSCSREDIIMENSLWSKERNGFKVTSLHHANEEAEFAERTKTFEGIVALLDEEIIKQQE